MAKDQYRGPLEQIDETLWRIPRSYRSDMRVDGHIFADAELMEHIRADTAPEQVANVATLPGIQMASLAMPDIHWGYGFCIGGVCATDPMEDGVISPAEWVTISTAVYGSSAPISISIRCVPSCGS